MKTHVLTCLTFFVKYPGWHGYDKRDMPTKKAVIYLEQKGFLEIWHDMARYTGKVF